MASKLRKCDRVFVFTMYFDAPNSDNSWSKSKCGENCNVTKYFGTVKAILVCLAVMKIKRKSKDVGCETVADSKSRVIIGLEIIERKEEMKKKSGAENLEIVLLQPLDWQNLGMALEE